MVWWVGCLQTISHLKQPLATGHQSRSASSTHVTACLHDSNLASRLAQQGCCCASGHTCTNHQRANGELLWGGLVLGIGCTQAKVLGQHRQRVWRPFRHQEHTHCQPCYNQGAYAHYAKQCTCIKYVVIHLGAYTPVLVNVVAAGNHEFCAVHISCYGLSIPCSVNQTQTSKLVCTQRQERQAGWPLTPSQRLHAYV